MRAKKDQPGPGTYSVPRDLKLSHVATIGRPTQLAVPGGGTGNSAPSWLKVDPDLGPGPGAYAVDSFTRNQRLAKVAENKSGR